jgi:hypothetical protein
VDSYYFTVADTNVADYDSTNRSYIIAKAPGTTTVGLTYINSLGGISYASFQLEVFQYDNLSSGYYHINSGMPIRNYTVYPAAVEASAAIYDFSNDLYLMTQWYIGNCGNGKYSIFSPIYQSYIGVVNSDLEENDGIQLFSTLSGVIPYWSILVNEEGDHLLVPDCDQETNLVMAVPTQSVSDGVSAIS